MRVLLSIVVAALMVAAGCASSETGRACEGAECEVDFVLGLNATKEDAVAPESWLWPNGDVYLIIDRGDVGWFSGFWTDRALNGAAEELAENTGVRLHFIEDASESSHGYFVQLKSLPSGGGWARYGTSGTEAASSAWSTRHEIGHILGLMHTHARVDRDEFIVVHTDWIQEGREHNFLRETAWTHIGPYDLSSVMQYGSFSVSRENEDGDSCATITDVAVGAQPEDCVTGGFFASLGFGSFITSESGYSDWNYSVIAALYCDERFCEDRCAPADRCGAPAVQAHLARLAEWEASDEGRRFRERYPQNSR